MWWKEEIREALARGCTRGCKCFFGVGVEGFRDLKI
jgi:hypothetical protein